MKKRVFSGANLTPFLNQRCLLLSISDDKTCYTLTLARLRKVHTYPETREVELIFDNHSLNHFPGNGWKDILFALPTPETLRDVTHRLPFVNRLC